MRLKIVTPTEVFLDEQVEKVVAEAPNGAFGMLPRHIDFVSALKPGILTYQRADGTERFVGTDAGTLVKCADTVFAATRNALAGDDLETLRARVEERFLQLDEQERIARTALARLEAGVIRRFIELEQAG
ncbi:MAG: F0F1 ATP synthase subunit epsilon [Alphaproteobacteria bacterium]